jgi:hypothetical protein
MKLLLCNIEKYANGWCTHSFLKSYGFEIGVDSKTCKNKNKFVK